MELYKRNIFSKLFFLRFSFLLFLFLFVLLFFSKYSDYSILVGILLCVLACFSVTNIIIFSKFFQIKKYYLSGIIPIKWTYTLNDNELIFPSSWLFGFVSSEDKYFYKRSVIKFLKNGKMTG